MTFENCKTIETTREVWKAILSAHEGQLQLFASSDGSDEKKTTFAIENTLTPIISATRTFETNPRYPDNGRNMKENYYLHSAIKQEDGDA